MEEMTGLDTRFLYSETSTTHMHTLKIVTVDVGDRDVPLTPDLFIGLLADRLDRMPALRRRRVAIPYRLGQPVWIEDDHFDIGHHVRWREAPAPGTLRELSDIAAEVAGVPLDPDRPLWEMTVVRGLEDNQVAIIVKLHHALADGGAAVAMLVNAFGTDPDTAIVQPVSPEPQPSRRTLFGVAFRARRRQVRQLPILTRETIEGMRAARRAAKGEDESLAFPFSGPRTPLNVSLTPERTFAMIELPMADLLAIKAAIPTTLNVVFLSVCAGALRRYLEALDALPAKSLVAGVPVGTSIDPTRLSGNHVDNMYVPLRTDIADPLERLRAVAQASRAARSVRAALGHEMLERRALLTPLNLYPLGLRLWARSRLANHIRPPINVIISNVPGPREPLRSEGGVITGLSSVGPILEGIGLNITAWSYVDKLNIAVLGCPASLPDPWALTAHLHTELENLGKRATESEPAGHHG